MLNQTPLNVVYCSQLKIEIFLLTGKAPARGTHQILQTTPPVESMIAG